jgi:hypothetical protein
VKTKASSTARTPDADEQSQSFVVKVWIEEPALASRSATWRGHITHVPSGDRQYFSDLGAIVAFISPRLTALGVDFAFRRRLWRLFTARFGVRREA